MTEVESKVKTIFRHKVTRVLATINIQQTKFVGRFCFARKRNGKRGNRNMKNKMMGQKRTEAQYSQDKDKYAKLYGFYCTRNLVNCALPKFK